MIELYTAIFLFGIGAYLNKNMKDPIEIKTTAPAKKETNENVYNTNSHDILPGMIYSGQQSTTTTKKPIYYHSKKRGK